MGSPTDRKYREAHRQTRQEELREKLSSQGYIQHITDITEELNDPGVDLSNSMIQRKKIVIDTKLKLINKYLPDVKAIEVSGKDGDDLIVKIVRKDFSGADSDADD